MSERDVIVRALIVDPPEVHVADRGGSAQLSVRILFSDGALVDVTRDPALTTYTVGDPSIASVDENGLILGLERGATEVSVGSGGAERSVPVVVGPRLDENCTATVLNRMTQVDQRGEFAVRNVPVPLGLSRVRVVCEQGGRTFRGQSPFHRGVANGVTLIEEIDFVEDNPIPVTLALTSPALVLTPSAPGAQLVTTGTLVDSTEVDLTLADSGTFYLSSNPSIATVSADGFVNAVSSGTFLVTAMHEGVIATIRLAVSFDGDADGDGLPDDFERLNGFNPGGANVARLPGVVVNVSSAHPSSPKFLAVDGNAQTSWFTAVGDAANRGQSPFIELVFPADQRVA
ncbi:MAG: Ig-like domain-containing protein, partial [Candidatus Rokuibacteriota bacterium]